MKTLTLVAVIGSLAVGLVSIYWASCPPYPDPVNYKVQRCFRDITSRLVFHIGQFLESFEITNTERLLRGYYSLGSKAMGKHPSSDFNVIVEESIIGNTPVVAFRPKYNSSLFLPGIIYFHGGGFVFGNPQTHTSFSSWLSEKADVVIISVDYGLSPETPYKSQIEECVSITRHVFDNAAEYGLDRNRIIVAGDSAGGNLASVVSVDLVNTPYKILASVLLSPAMQAVNLSLPSYRAYRTFINTPTEFYFAKRVGQKYNDNVKLALRQGRHIPLDLLNKFNTEYLDVSSIPDYSMPTFPLEEDDAELKITIDSEIDSISELALYTVAWPLLADDTKLKRLSPTFIQVCEYDSLRDDGLLYAHRLRKNDVATTLSYLHNAFHVEPIYAFFLPKPFSPVAQRGLDDVLSFIKSVI